MTRCTEKTLITMHDITKGERDILEEALLENIKHHIRKGWTGLARLRHNLLQEIIPDVVSFEALSIIEHTELEAEGNDD